MCCVTLVVMLLGASGVVVAGGVGVGVGVLGGVQFTG